MAKTRGARHHRSRRSVSWRDSMFDFPPPTSVERGTAIIRAADLSACLRALRDRDVAAYTCIKWFERQHSGRQWMLEDAHHEMEIHDQAALTERMLRQFLIPFLHATRKETEDDYFSFSAKLGALSDYPPHSATFLNAFMDTIRDLKHMERAAADLADFAETAKVKADEERIRLLNDCAFEEEDLLFVEHYPVAKIYLDEEDE